MKRTFAILIFTLACLPSTMAQIGDFIINANTFFSANVNSGRVNYSAISSKPQQLDSLISTIETFDFSQLNQNDQKAYLINSYNLLVIKQIADNYPISSPMEVSGFFDTNKFNVGGKKMTLNDIENDVIRPTFDDPRVHFVLVCGANGCPPIVDHAYTPNQIEDQLNAQTKKAMNDTNFIRSDNLNQTVMISEIFKWYSKDFRSQSENDIQYINKHRDSPIPESYKIRYYQYDWSVNEYSTTITSEESSNTTTGEINTPTTNLQTYTAGSLLKKGQLDLTLFNSMYTENKSNWLGTDYTGFRNTFASSLIQFTYGVSKSARFNIGVDINLKGSGTSSDSTLSGVRNAFRLVDTDSTRGGVAYIAPRIKVAPFANEPDFSIQSTFISSFAENPEGATGFYWIEWDRYIWWNQLFYSKSFGKDKFQLFTELDLLFRFAKRKEQSSHVDIPVSAFLSYFPTKKVTIYAMTQHVPRFVYDNGRPEITDWVVGANYTQSGIGFKYQVLPSMNLELLYTNFWRSVNAGQGATINLGIKYVR